MSGRNYFICTVQFTCPFCRARSSEDVVVDSTGTDSTQVFDFVSRDTMVCQECRGQLPSGVHIHINVRPASAEDVRNSGYAPEPAD
jgi:hypothetical protein